MRGHMWTALLNPIDRPPTPSILSRTSLPRPSFHPKPLHYSSHSPLILISMLLLISGDIHPNPGPIDPCSVCSRRVTWGNRSIQCAGCSLWVHLTQRRKAFAKAHCSEEYRQHYIATSRYTSTVINKAKAKSWQNTCSSLSPKTRPSEVFSLLRSISGSPSPTTSDLPNFSNCHTPVDCANHLSSHLQSHFSTQTPKPFRSTEKAQMKQIRTAHCNTLHSTFCSPFSSIELSTAISQLSTSTSSGPDQITYPLLSHLPQSALNFLLYIFNLSWSTHTFPSAWKQSTIIPILKSGKPSDSPSSYRPISLTSCTSKLFERMVLGRLTYFLELT